jgi:hypothetical protein
MIVKVKGTKLAFFEFLQLPDGRTVGELADGNLSADLPRLLTG